MEFNNQKFLLLSVVYLYDMLSVDKIPLDKLREIFKEINYHEELNLMLIGDAKNKCRVSIESTKLGYNDDNQSSFEERNLNRLYELLKLIPFTFRAYGVNLHIRGEIKNSPIAGEYLRDKFLPNRKDLEKKVEGEIFAHSTRFFLGKPEHYRDLRIFPTDLRGNIIEIHYHLHKDIHIVDSERLIQDTEDSVKSSIADFSRIIHSL